MTLPTKSRQSAGTSAHNSRIQKLSQVLDAFSDQALFTDRAGFVLAIRGKLRGLNTANANGLFFASLLQLPMETMAEALKKYPPGRVHAIPAPHYRSTWALRIIPLPELFSPSGFVILVTDNKPLHKLRETYKERIGEKIQALENSIHLFGAMFDGIQDAMLLLGDDHIVHSANPKAMELLDPNRLGLLGRYVRSLFAPADWDKLSRKLSTLRDGGRWTSRRTCKTTKGDELPVEVTLWRIDLEGFTLFHLALRDLTAQTLLEKGLRRKKAEVEGMNLALRNVVQSSEQEKRNVRREIMEEIKEDVLPALARLAQEASPELRHTLKTMIEERIHEMAAGSFKKLSPLVFKLTPREIEVCKLIRLGSGTKDIAELLNASFETIQTHRKNIRRKLSLRGRSMSLFSFLHQQEFPE